MSFLRSVLRLAGDGMAQGLLQPQADRGYR